MDTIFTNSKNGKTSNSYRLLLKIDLKRSDKKLNLSIYYT